MQKKAPALKKSTATTSVGSLGGSIGNGSDDDEGSDINKNESKSKNTKNDVISPIEDRLLELGEIAREEMRLKRQKSLPKFKPKIYTGSYIIQDWDRYDLDVSDRLYEVAKENYQKELDKKNVIDTLTTLPPMESADDRLVKYGLKMYSPRRQCFPNPDPNPDPQLAPATKRLLKTGKHLSTRSEIRSANKVKLKNGQIKVLKEEEPVEGWLYYKGNEYNERLKKMKEDIQNQMLCKYKLPKYERPEIPLITIGENSEKIVRDKEAAFRGWTHKFRLAQKVRNVKPVVLRDLEKMEPTFEPKVNQVKDVTKVVTDEDLMQFYYSITSSPDLVNNCYILPHFEKSRSTKSNSHGSSNGNNNSESPHKLSPIGKGKYPKNDYFYAATASATTTSHISAINLADLNTANSIAAVSP